MMKHSWGVFFFLCAGGFKTCCQMHFVSSFSCVMLFTFAM